VGLFGGGLIAGEKKKGGREEIFHHLKLGEKIFLFTIDWEREKGGGCTGANCGRKKREDAFQDRFPSEGEEQTVTAIRGGRKSLRIQGATGRMKKKKSRAIEQKKKKGRGLGSVLPRLSLLGEKERSKNQGGKKGRREWQQRETWTRLGNEEKGVPRYTEPRALSSEVDKEEGKRKKGRDPAFSREGKVKWRRLLAGKERRQETAGCLAKRKKRRGGRPPTERGGGGSYTNPPYL